MITTETAAKILRLHHAEKWKIGTIADQLGVHHSAVRRVLAQAGIGQKDIAQRVSIADPYLPFILQTLKEYPNLRASRLYEMVKERGYPGKQDHFRHVVSQNRPQRGYEAYLRLKTMAGEQAQVDWAHFGTVTIGKADRRLAAFVMVLSWSRRIFLRFFLNQQLENFLRGHQYAFEKWRGVPRVLLYDNLKSAVLERQGNAIRFHPTLLNFATHYHFEPRPVAVARGNEKGRVERAIQYVRHAFFAARKWRDLDDLNQQAEIWCDTIAAERRCPEDRTRTVADAYAEEQPKLIALPNNPYPIDERVEVKVGKTPYVRFDGNDYSVPHTLTRKTLVVLGSPVQVRVLDGSQIVATHSRTYGKWEQIECAGHIADLVIEKRRARVGSATSQLTAAVPNSARLLQSIAERGGGLGGSTTRLLNLLEQHGGTELDAAIGETIVAGTPSLASVHVVLDRRLSERKALPPVPVHLPDDPRVRNLVVRQHSLQAYDQQDCDQQESTREEEKNEQK